MSNDRPKPPCLYLASRDGTGEPRRKAGLARKTRAADLPEALLQATETTENEQRAALLPAASGIN